MLFLIWCVDICTFIFRQNESLYSIFRASSLNEIKPKTRHTLLVNTKAIHVHEMRCQFKGLPDVLQLIMHWRVEIDLATDSNGNLMQIYLTCCPHETRRCLYKLIPYDLTILSVWVQKGHWLVSFHPMQWSLRVSTFSSLPEWPNRDDMSAEKELFSFSVTWQAECIAFKREKKVG